jgi:hypothetical protein
MNLIYPNSLSKTLDAVNEKVFFKLPISSSEKKAVATWIAGRQGAPGSYANMFAPTGSDIKEGFKVFTGEPITTGAATRHILGEEACRALILLDIKTPVVKKALALATAGIEYRVLDSVTRGYQIGTYCCGRCTASFWRHLAVGGIKNISPEQWLVAGMKTLKPLRLENGEWRRFPFFYTLLALEELDFPAAIAELKYAAPRLEQYLKHSSKNNKFTQRRKVLAERILSKI